MRRIGFLLATFVVLLALMWWLVPAIGQTVTVSANIPADFNINLNTANLALNKPAAAKYGDWTSFVTIGGTASLPLNLYAEDTTGNFPGYLVQGTTTLANLLACGINTRSYDYSDVTFATLNNRVLLNPTPIPGSGGFSRILWFKQPVTFSGDSAHTLVFSKDITIDVTVVYP